MNIDVTAKPGKKKEFVTRVNGKSYIVSVREPPREGKANTAIQEALAEYFDIPKSQVVLVTGQTSKHKVFQIPDDLADFEPHDTQRELF